MLNLRAEWRLAGLLSLAFAEDLAVVDGRDGTIARMSPAVLAYRGLPGARESLLAWLATRGAGAAHCVSP